MHSDSYSLASYFPNNAKILFSSSSVSGAARLNTTCETTVSLPEDSDEQQEVIEVQILPQVRYIYWHTQQWLTCISQDENWGETTTAVTNVSELDYAMEDLSKWQIDNQRSFQFRWHNIFIKPQPIIIFQHHSRFNLVTIAHPPQIQPSSSSSSFSQ